MKKNSTPNNSGSAGIDKDSPMSIPKSSKLIDKGVKNATRNKTLSKDKTNNIKKPNNKGNANIMYLLFSTTRKVLKATNNAMIR